MYMENWQVREGIVLKTDKGYIRYSTSYGHTGSRQHIEFVENVNHATVFARSTQMLPKKVKQIENVKAYSAIKTVIVNTGDEVDYII